MTYEEAREYIQTVSKTGSILGLTSIQNLMRELGDVQDKISIIHIAGTNGKGSVGTYLSAGLCEAGYTVGRYTSPAVFSPLEVWQINGEFISEADYADTMSQVKAACDVLVSKGMPHPTAFEVETAVAFLYFYQKKCDYVLLETGMGGSTDATNLIKHPVCSVITSISMDHMNFLGDSLSEIAGAKAGIIKKDCPVATIMQQQAVMSVIKGKAKEEKAELLIADSSDVEICAQSPFELVISCPIREGDKTENATFTTKMTGIYQVENLVLAIRVLQEVLGLSVLTIQQGIAKATWSGRFEVLRKHPLFIMDGAHNEAAAVRLRETVQTYFAEKRITYIIGVLADKEHEKMLETLLPFAETVYTVTPSNPRALDGRELAKEAKKYHTNVAYCDSEAEAVKSAMEPAGEEDVILAFGSLSYLGAVKETVLQMKDSVED